MEFEEEILIPKTRVAVLIGPKGATRKKIEELGKIRVYVDKNTNNIRVTATDALDLMIGKHVVEAIGRGFSPEKAQKLFKEEYQFEILNIADFRAKTKQDLIRLKGRVIGQNGKSKSLIQRYTDADIVVLGKTVAIIAPVETMSLARQAVERLLSGAQHAGVFRLLERRGKRKEKIDG